MRVQVSQEGRIHLQQEPVTPVRSPKPTRDSPESSEGGISPPKDPILLHIIGAGKLATAPARIRMPLDDGDRNFHRGRDPNVSLEPIKVEYFHPELNGWRPWRPAIPKVAKKDDGRYLDGDDESEEEQSEGGKIKHKKPRWKRHLGIFKVVTKPRKDKKDDDDKEPVPHRPLPPPGELIYYA